MRAEFEDVPQASTEIPKETEIRPERMTEGAGLAEEKRCGMNPNEQKHLCQCIFRKKRKSVQSE
ncbi:hypothetical protein PO124_09930 [Bacillus licheniformis]|nr:hypothetical protein [Bacillus licheniformis]